MVPSLLMARSLNSGTVELIASWPWQAFISLSWPDVRPGVLPGRWIRERIFFSWIRRAGLEMKAGRRGVDWLWCRRDEQGEKTGREHLHVLIGGCPEWFVRDFVLRPKSAVGYWWEQIGGGNVRTSPVSTYQVVDYFSKNIENASSYELKKFGGRCAVMLSNHAQHKLLCAVARNRGRNLTNRAWPEDRAPKLDAA